MLLRKFITDLKNTALTIVAVISTANSVDAQGVRIQNGEGAWGYGWMFQHAGNCYAALPRHVAGEFYPKVTISTSAPVISDQAIVIRPFWEGFDLAIAVLDRGPLDSRCSAKLEDLRASSSTRSSGTALLLRITPAGEEERLPLTIGDRPYLTFEGEVTREGDRIGQGTSGAFAFVNGRPIGMAYETIGTTGATFMRSEEIAMNLERFLSEQGAAFTAEPIPGPKAPPENTVTLRDASANVLPVLPQFGPENLLGEGLFVAKPNGRVELTFRVDSASAEGVSRIRLSAPTNDSYAVPKSIAIYLDAGEAGDRYRFWTQGQMGPNGVFDTGPLAARNTRWVRIIILSAWDEGNIALEELLVE